MNRSDWRANCIDLFKYITNISYVEPFASPET